MLTHKLIYFAYVFMASGGERATGAGGEKAVTGDALLMQMSSVREGSRLKGKWEE